jgi:hypothetical protein
MMKQPVDRICRMCYNAERIKRTVAGCTTFAPPEYASRHSKVADYVHGTIWKHMGLRVADRYYGHIPEMVLNANGATIMWDVPVITDSTIVANRPDIVLSDKIEKNCLLNEMAMPNDSNINTKENEKLSKYKDLEIAVKRMWKARTKVVPVITGALGTIKKALDQNLQLLLLTHQPQGCRSHN